MKPSELMGVGLLIAGFVLFVAGYWLVWDYTNSLIRFLDWERFCREWRFPAPFFLYWWTCENYTGAYDLALTLAGIGIIAAMIGAYIVGYTRE